MRKKSPVPPEKGHFAIFSDVSISKITKTIPYRKNMNQNLYTYYMEKLQIYSLNCRGLNTYQKRVKLFTWLIDINADVIFLQETHFIEKNQFIYDSRWHGKTVHCFSESQYSRGVSILFRKGLPVKILNTHKSEGVYW